jgi:hypothetical protein
MEDRNKWKISEIWPNLQDTTYRIRTLNGLALTMASTSINVKGLELGSLDQLVSILQRILSVFGPENLIYSGLLGPR